ncbi:helix-turn-helix domain-containing protein [Azospirillum sp. sgz302134]
MQLSSYMEANGETDATMAAKVGVSIQAMNRYRLGQRRPREAEMVRIFEVTNGEVTPNDFFDLPKPIPRHLSNEGDVTPAELESHPA